LAFKAFILMQEKEEEKLIVDDFLMFNFFPLNKK
jgi:hypothetical protein